MARRSVGPQTVSSGPFKGVVNTQQPYDDAPNTLVDAENMYIPDPATGSEILARPGYGPISSFGFATPGQGIHAHTDQDGATYNFVASGGVLYRIDGSFGTPTTVTPAGSPISSTAPRVYFTSFLGQLVISDGVNRPWVASNLSSNPVTRTPIDFDGAGTAWSAFGQPEVYAGSIFFILNSVGGVASRLDIAWSAPADPFTGYQQTNYDYRWTLSQTGTGPIYAIKATNVALYYWRDQSIGAITGTPGPDLQQTATHDAVSVNVGTMAPATVKLFGEKIYFCDVAGRPWMFQVGGGLQPIWQQMRTPVKDSTANYATVTAQVASATVIPDLNLYAAAIWSPTPGAVQSPNEMQVFDANTGTYVGRWTLGDSSAAIDVVGVLVDSAGHQSFAAVAGQVSAFPVANPLVRAVWVQYSVAADIAIDTESGLDLTTEDSVTLITETSVMAWTDAQVDPPRSVTTQRLGYSDGIVYNVDRGTIVTGTSTPCSVTATTPTASSVVEGTPTPSPSADGTYRLVFGADVQGRGLQLTIAPTTATEQWSLYSASALMVPSLAGPEEA